MGRSRLGWACVAVAPWFLGFGLVVSITADAGQEPTLGASVASRNSSYPTGLPIREPLLSPAEHAPGDYFDRAVSDSLGLQASLTLGSPDDLSASDDEIEPKADLKRAGPTFPTVDRTDKGDPFIGLRPGFSARLNRLGGPGGPASSESDRDDDPFGQDPFGAWPPTPLDGPPAGDAAASPTSAAPDQPAPFSDGATPSVPLEVALNSATPTSSDGALIIATGKNAPEMTLAPKVAANGRPDYASLIDPKDAARQQRCLAEAVYFEARGEPEEGQAAVAQVVLNRVRSGLFPSNVCGVVYQDRNRPFACQFSFACEGRSLRIEEPAAWATAVRIAHDVVSGVNYNPLVGEAVNYHANYVTPYWASALQRVDRIGHHIFYKLRIGRI